jgi:catechol 2,3-dioxygenase-like lactoylglutathione lyase family enzyme
MAKMIHSMIRVLDLQRAIDFYARALGLGVFGQFEFDDFTLVYLRNEESDFELRPPCGVRGRLPSRTPAPFQPGTRPGPDQRNSPKRRAAGAFLLHRGPGRLQDRGAGALRSLSMTTQLHSKTKVREQVRR